MVGHKISNSKSNNEIVFRVFEALTDLLFFFFFWPGTLTALSFSYYYCLIDTTPVYFKPAGDFLDRSCSRRITAIS